MVDPCLLETISRTKEGNFQIGKGAFALRRLPLVDFCRKLCEGPNQKGLLLPGIGMPPLPALQVPILLMQKLLLQACHLMIQLINGPCFLEQLHRYEPAWRLAATRAVTTTEKRVPRLLEV